MSSSSSEKNTRNLIWFLIAAVCVLVDQITKVLVVKNIELYKTVNVIGDFSQFTHIRNTAAGFSLGENLPSFWKVVLIKIVPLLFILGIVYILIFSDKYEIKTRMEKLSLALIIGGGFGNLVDRFFRKDGVVDFIRVKVYGLFGMDYWPVFNIADSVVVIGVILLLVFVLIINPIKQSKANKLNAASAK